MTLMNTERPIIIVGLGPGQEEAASRRALEVVRGGFRVYVAAPGHLATSLVGEPRALPEGLSGDPTAIARFLVDKAWDGELPVVLAVPGSPFVAEPIVSRLLSLYSDDIRVIPGVSFLDTLWGSLGVDPFQNGVRLVPADSAQVQTLGSGRPAVITDLTAASVARLAALAKEGLPGEVVVAHHVGQPDESLLRVPLTELGEVGGLDEYTSLFLPRATVAGSTLAEAVSAQHRGTRMGYGMADLEAAFADVEAEVLEAREEPSESEVGDILFAAVQVSRLLQVDPDRALRGAVGRFTGRLDYINGLGENLAACSPEQLRRFWAEAKRQGG
ncbi:SAM-dependent methyltransferase [Streptomyces sp. NEAU-Y11]|uniref:SAM-dependent methyltransferase n=1 Tax=Streptomyces cucumeris TaxID=2962890 RepID=UPI0020C86745|nr:SAM-dependent methyltransferase [Streptomyces sp. NEAU-Y11]MCP9211491.1 SAM-dependent methyltransferase [Streptomyces sp. NEAU-Y11]